MTSSLWSRFPWVTTTPFGVPVEPDVYWRKATVSGDTSGRRHGPGSVAVSLTSQRSSPSSGAAGRSAWASSRMNPVVSSVRAPQSDAIARNLGRLCSRRVGSGGYAGTATTPAYRQPNQAVRNSRPGG